MLYILKKILKDKNKPYFGKKANEKYENLFSISQPEKSNSEKIIYGIIQEIGDGHGNVTSGIYLDDSFKHIRKDGKISEFKIKDIPNHRLLKTKSKLFHLLRK